MRTFEIVAVDEVSYESVESQSSGGLNCQATIPLTPKATEKW